MDVNAFHQNALFQQQAMHQQFQEIVRRMQEGFNKQRGFGGDNQENNVDDYVEDHALSRGQNFASPQNSGSNHFSHSQSTSSSCVNGVCKTTTCTNGVCETTNN